MKFIENAQAAIVVALVFLLGVTGGVLFAFCVYWIGRLLIYGIILTLTSPGGLVIIFFAIILLVFLLAVVILILEEIEKHNG